MPAIVPELHLASQVHFHSVSSVDVDLWKEWLLEMWELSVEWLSQPHILAIIIAWAATFTLIVTLVLTLGFDPVGIGAGSLAACFQSYMYGGFTPAGGIFATLTSAAMLGTMMPLATVSAGLVATAVSVIVWALGVGR